MRPFPVLLACSVFVCSLLGAGAAHGGNFSVSPIRVELAPGQRAGAVTIRNEDPEPVTVQVDAVRWSQVDGADRLEPTADLVTSPVLVTLAPGAQQIVRVGLVAGRPADREATYRLILREVPRPRGPGETGLRVALRISLPVFVAPPGPAPRAQLAWQWRRDGDALVLRASNHGSAHVQVTGFALQAQGAATDLVHAEAFYVLPGAHRDFHFDSPAQAVPARVRARLGAVENDFEVALPN